MSEGEDHIVIPASGPRLSISTANTPQTLDLRIQIARLAMDFFDPEKPNTFAEALGKPGYDRDSLTGEDFRQYMLESADFFSSLHSIFVLPVLREMVRANLLHDHGVSRSTDGLLGHAYRTVAGAITNSQRSGSLWLSRVLGPELIIANYEAVTVHIVGKYSNGDFANGSGLVLDREHILTNAHVLNDCQVESLIPAPRGIPPAVEWRETGPEIKLRLSDARIHPRIDVAVIPVDTRGDASGMNALSGVAFRDPEWSDETYIFGYPPVSKLDGPYLVVQRGEVVNPSVTGQYEEQYFLYSAIARPGNSGGPIVAQDGRVVGLVTGELPDAEQKTLPFYPGVPATQIREALDDLGVEHLIRWEDWHF